MSDFGYFQSSVVPPGLLQSGAREIYDFTISLVLGKQLMGSGTLISYGSTVGIVTAQHVSAPLFHERSGDIGLVFANQVHSVYEPVDHFEEIVVGVNVEENEFGPDLSFIRLLDPNLVSAIRARKSFYSIDGKNFERFANVPYEEMSWFVSGAPDKLRQVVAVRPDGSPDTVRHAHFVVESVFRSRDSHEGFDLIRLQVRAGADGCPENYGGVSGGGIWLLPITMDPDVGPPSINHDAPFFAGVAFYQAVPHDGYAIITGHGPDSIYRRLVQKICEPPA